MKKQNLTSILLALALASALAACHRHPAPPKQYNGVGVVQAIDQNAGTVQLNHQDIPGYMPAMTMNFRVKRKAVLDQVKVGDKVNFTLRETQSGVVVTKIDKAQ